MARTDGSFWPTFWPTIVYLLGLPVSFVMTFTIADTSGLIPPHTTMPVNWIVPIAIVVTVVWAAIGIGYLVTSPSSNPAWSHYHVLFQILTVPFLFLGVFGLGGLFLCSCGLLAFLVWPK